MAIHLYYGDGKGKTTAAVGLAIRALGHGKKVVFVSFLKRGDSGEVAILKKLGAEVLAKKAGKSFRVSDMSEEEIEENRRICNENLKKAGEKDFDILILDELCAALRHGLLDEDTAKRVVLLGQDKREVIVTGRRPAQWLLDYSDYITEMKCERHIINKGIPAREGIEF